MQGYSKHLTKEECVGLLEWAIGALVISLIAGALGFTGIASGAATVSRIFFVLFLIVAIALFLMLALGVSLFT